MVGRQARDSQKALYFGLTSAPADLESGNLPEKRSDPRLFLSGGDAGDRLRQPIPGADVAEGTPGNLRGKPRRSAKRTRSPVPGPHNRYSPPDSVPFGDVLTRNPDVPSRWERLHSLIYFGAGLKPQEAACLFGRGVDTIAAWEGSERAPADVWRALLAMAGDLGAVDARFRGWRLVDGRLYSPDMRDGWGPGEIRALPFLHGALTAYRAGKTGGPPPERMENGALAAPDPLAALAGPVAAAGAVTRKLDGGQPPSPRPRRGAGMPGLGNPRHPAGRVSGGGHQGHPDRSTAQDWTDERSGPHPLTAESLKRRSTPGGESEVSSWRHRSAGTIPAAVVTGKGNVQVHQFHQLGAAGLEGDAPEDGIEVGARLPKAENRKLSKIQARGVIADHGDNSVVVGMRHKSGTTEDAAHSDVRTLNPETEELVKPRGKLGNAGLRPKRHLTQERSGAKQKGQKQHFQVIDNEMLWTPVAASAGVTSTGCSQSEAGGGAGDAGTAVAGSTKPKKLERRARRARGQIKTPGWPLAGTGDVPESHNRYYVKYCVLT